MADITSPPAHNGVQDNGRIREGLAEILPIEGNKVFYNPVQVFNRDTSVLALNVFETWRKDHAPPGRAGKALNEELKKSNEGLTVFEAMAASGLRSVRYAKEVRNLKHVVVNDLDEKAAENIKANLEHNSIPSALAEASHSDCIRHMQHNDLAYDVIDLDPYGSASPFLDGALNSVKNGGLLCVTCTDSAVLCGNHTDVCYYRYGGVAPKAKYCHELALRLMLHAISTAAGRRKRALVPLLSLSIDFYYRVFVRVIDSPKDCGNLAADTSLLLQCVNCEWHQLSPLAQSKSESNPNLKPGTLLGQHGGTAPPATCPICQGRLAMGGPCWTGPLHDASFVSAMLAESSDSLRKTERFPGVTAWKKMRKAGRVKNLPSLVAHVHGLLTAVSMELPGSPLFYTLDGLMSISRAPNCPLQKFKNTLVNLGYKVSHFHREPMAIKSDAPAEVVFDLKSAEITTLQNLDEPSVFYLYLLPVAMCIIIYAIAVCIVNDQEVVSNASARAWALQHQESSGVILKPKIEGFLEKGTNSLPDGGDWRKIDFDQVPPRSGGEEDEQEDDEEKHHKKRTPMFLPNPESNWGPKRAAAGWPGGKCKKAKTHHEGQDAASPSTGDDEAC
ncbi:tRNA methyltransferase 1 [Perkinsus chesapeaki]|uniref:tRNA (guanine(26)-N(2))-dimethyltransferase n=1 Tax=Perkinsus chesapeaki TaxID=330153 RepID=A0A7J6LMH7_PERCH|nr:tRNA methyltransferase 1 [Perkinsus chesapeaki]